MKCDELGCEAEAICGFLNNDKKNILIKCREHAHDVESIMKVSTQRLLGLQARISLTRMTVDEALVHGVMMG
jgi:hypothetical protein